MVGSYDVVCVDCRFVGFCYTPGLRWTEAQVLSLGEEGLDIRVLLHAITTSKCEGFGGSATSNSV